MLASKPCSTLYFFNQKPKLSVKCKGCYITLKLQSLTHTDCIHNIEDGRKFAQPIKNQECMIDIYFFTPTHSLHHYGPYLDKLCYLQKQKLNRNRKIRRVKLGSSWNMVTKCYFLFFLKKICFFSSRVVLKQCLQSARTLWKTELYSFLPFGMAVKKFPLSQTK